MKRLTFSLFALLATAALLSAAPPRSVVPAKAPPQCVVCPPVKPAACSCPACGCAECDCTGGRCACPSCMAVTAPRADGKVQFCVGGTCYLLTPEQAKDKGLLAALRGENVPTGNIPSVYTRPVYTQPLNYFGGGFGSCPGGNCSPGR